MNNKEAAKLREQVSSLEAQCLEKDETIASLRAKLSACEEKRAESEKKVTRLESEKKAFLEEKKGFLECEKKGLLECEKKGVVEKKESQAPLVEEEARKTPLATQLKEHCDSLSLERRRSRDLEARLGKMSDMYARASKNLKVLTTTRQSTNETLKRSLQGAERLASATKSATEDANDAARSVATQIETIGALLADAGHLRDAEVLYDHSASVRGQLFGANHAEHANNFRKMADHCQKRNDLTAAVAYLERSCEQYAHSLHKQEPPNTSS